MFTSHNVDTPTLRRLAVEADADPRSVAKELKAPGSVRGAPGHRIRKVLTEHALAAPAPEQSSREPMR